MAEKQIAWASGEGYITVIFGGGGNGSVSVSSDDNVSYDAREQAVIIRTTTGSPEQTQTLLIKQEGKRLAAGTTFKFDYTGAVQSVDLPAGRYKLQCWGAQGGSVTGTYAIAGSNGGYSEGVLALTEPKTLYVFVGGKGTDYTSSASQTSTTVINGGWNGGGAGVRTALYDSGDTNGRSFPRGGGGATDIALVTSSMSYSSGRTARSDASLKSRIIVAGGGAGASARYTIKTTTTTSTSEKTVATYNKTLNATSSDGTPYASVKETNIKASTQYKVKNFTGTYFSAEYYGASGYIGNNKGATTFTTPSNCTFLWVHLYDSKSSSGAAVSATLAEVVTTTSTDTSTSSGKSSRAQQGGGTSGKGQYPASQSSAGNGGAFGLGANQSATNYRYCGGGGGGGWYGGGTNKSDTSTSYVNYSGGGSGFVNTAANASYRPSGYTGIELESGSTTAGSSSHPSTSGGSETGHSGNGYAIITVL